MSKKNNNWEMNFGNLIYRLSLNLKLFKLEVNEQNKREMSKENSRIPFKC